MDVNHLSEERLFSKGIPYEIKSDAAADRAPSTQEVMFARESPSESGWDSCRPRHPHPEAS